MLSSKKKITSEREYEWMIKDFKTQETKTKYMEAENRKLKDLNKKWKRSIDKMKVSKEADFLNERDKILNKVGKKTQISKIKQSENKEQKMKFITEIQIKNKDSVKLYRKNYNCIIMK